MNDLNYAIFASPSRTSSQGSQPELVVRNPNPPGPFVLEDNEIEQIWWLRKGGGPCPGVGDTNRHALHSLAEDFWKDEAAEASHRLDASSSSLAVSNNELYQLIGFYSVFQGVLLTASAQSNLLRCSHWWIPIILCILATIITCWGVWLKLNEVREFRDRRNKFNVQLNHRISQLSSLRQYRQCFYFPASTSTPLPQPSRFSKKDTLVIVAIVAFAAIIGGGSYAILCKPGTACSPQV
ncbi:hypothetical protein KC19_12G174700 [Ceratodon purpureus]|uniref:Uncharacterized protein n=1 Tax=Ceratodon purpureus TaxID=3225 RepID=A0A8T0GCF0_CERPU|nr:hypothetical protein KC19_12G174700 [Ceratodon purpureus]